MLGDVEMRNLGIGILWVQRVGCKTKLDIVESAFRVWGIHDAVHGSADVFVVDRREDRINDIDIRHAIVASDHVLNELEIQSMDD